MNRERDGMSEKNLLTPTGALAQVGGGDEGPTSAQVGGGDDVCTEINSNWDPRAYPR